MNMKPITKNQQVRVIYFQTEDGNIYATDSRFAFMGPPVSAEEKARRAMLGKYENQMIDAGISPSTGKMVGMPMAVNMLGEGAPVPLSIMTILDDDILKMKSYLNKMAGRNDKLAGLLQEVHPAVLHEQNNRYNILATQVDPMITYPTEPGELLLLAAQEPGPDGKLQFRHTQSRVTAVITHNISRDRQVITSSHSGANQNELQKKAFLANAVNTHLNDGSSRTSVTFGELLQDNSKSVIGIVASDPKNPDFVYQEGEALSFDKSDIGKKPVVLPFAISTQASDELESYHGVNNIFGEGNDFLEEKWVPIGKGKEFNPANMLTTHVRLNTVIEQDNTVRYEIQRKLDIREDDVYLKIAPIVQNSLSVLDIDQLSVGQLIGLLVVYPNGRAVIRVGDITILKKGVK